MADEFSRVHIWVGYFSPPDFLHGYVAERKEHFEDESDTVPISQFAEDTGAWFIDHDFLCIMFEEAATTDIRHLLEETLISSGFGDDAIAEQYSSKYGNPVNGIILVYGDEVQAPVSVLKDVYQLYYLGRFYEQPSHEIRQK